MTNLTLKLVKTIHKGYKLLLSPLFGDVCRFYPYCSDYAVEAIEKHGFWRGAMLATKRVVRCNPRCEGGFDPVPPATTNSK